MKILQKLRTRLCATSSRLAAFLLAATAASGAWAATPVASWTDFRTATSGSYTWDVSNCSVDSDTGVLTIGSSGGMFMDISSIGSDNRSFTVAIEAEIPTTFSSDATVVDLIVNGSHVSVAVNGTTMGQCWTTGAVSSTSYGKGTFTSDRQLLTFTFQGASGQGSHTYLNGTQLAASTGLMSSSGSVTHIGIGAFNKTSEVATGMKIYSVRLYDSKLAAADVTTDYSTYGVADYTATVTSDTTLESLTWTAVDGTTTTTMPSSYTKLDLRGSGTVTSTSAYAALMTIADGVTFQPASVSSTAAFFGTGRILCTAIPANSTWTDISWTGTLALKDLTFENKAFSSYGYTGSTVELIGVQGYHTERLGQSQTWVNPTIKLTNSTTSGSEFGFKSTNGWSDKYTTFNKVTGSGTLTSSGTQTQLFRIADASGFTGSVSMGSRPVVFGTTSTSATSGTITIDSGNTITVGDGATWTASNGIIVNGALTIGSGATVSTIASSSTGSVTVTSGTGTVSGIDGSEFPATIVIYPNATLAIADTSVTALTIPAEFVTFTDFTYYNQGTLDLTGCTSLTTLYLDMGSSTTFSLANVSLPTTCTTVAVDAGSTRSLSGYTVTKAASGQDDVTIAYAVEETKAEYANGTLEVTDVPTDATVYVLRADGTTVTATVTDTTARLSDYGTIRIDGAATAYDVTFTNTYAMAYYRSYAVVSANGAGDTLYNNTASDKTTGMYLYKTPWIGNGGSNLPDLATIQSSMTLAVVGQMPAVQDDAMFIHLGGCGSGYKGFLIARTSTDDQVRVAYNNGPTVTTLTTMTVPNASTARHAYVITKVDTDSTTTFTIYLDGIKWKTVTLDSVLAISGGVQVGSDFHGAIHPATQTDTDGTTTYQIKSITSSSSPSSGYVTDTTGYVNCIRLYDRIISDAEIAAYSATSEYPYVSPNGSSVRTFTAASEDWVEDGATDWANTTAAGVTTQEASPTAGAALTVNTSVATTIGVNLDSSVNYEAITVNGTGATFENADGSTGTITITGSSVIGAPTTIKAGALSISGGPVTMTEDGSLAFDYSDYEVTSTTTIQLTGPIAQNDSAVTITVPSSPYYTYTAGYDSTSEQYVITPAVAVAVLNHEGTITGYTTVDAAMAYAVSGDTVTLQTAYLTPSTDVATYAADMTGVNVIVQGYTIEPVVSDDTTTWTTPSAYVWTGAGSDTNWTTPANWGLASGYPGSSGAANSQNTDNVLVPSAATITLTGNAYLTSVTLSGNLTLTGGGTLYARTISGSKVILSSATLRAYQNGKTNDANSLIVSSDVEIADGTENGFYMGRSSDNNYSTKFELAGALTGTGKVTVTISRADYQGITVSGDASAFAGEWEVSGSGDVTQFSAATQVSSTASYTFNSRNNGANGSYPFNLSGGSFAVGALNGTIYSCGGSNRAYGMTITVGGRNEDCSFGGSIGYASAYCNNLVKTGTADMTYTGGGFYGSMTIQNGTYIIGSTDANPATIIFQGGALSVAEGITVDPSSHFSSASTAAVVFDDRGYDNDNEWATALTATTAPYGLTKKGSGTLTLKAVPTYTGTTTVEAGVLEVPQGTTIAELALTDGKIAIALEGAVSDTTVLTVTSLADGTTFTADDIVLSDASTTLTLDTETTPGSVIVKATREVKNYVWTGATSTAFDTLSNWLVNDAVPTEAPYADIDTIEFPADGAPWTVALSEDVEIASVAVNGAVTLTGGKLLANAFTGSAAITLGGNAGIGDYEPSATMTIANPIVVSGTGNSLNANTVYVTYSGAISSADDTAELTLYGAVERVNLTGDNSGLQGTVYMNGCVTLENSNAGSANAKWVIANTPGYYANPIRANSVQFGELSGTYTHVPAANNNINYSMYVGALGTSFTLGGGFSANNSGRADTIYKVGAGTMTFTGRYVNWLNLNEGTVYVTSTDATVVHNGVAFNGGVLQLASGVTQDFSGLVQSSTAAVKVGVDDGASLTWATALNANNTVAEIEKYGAGTLTLTYAPTWDSTKVTVAEGSLVMPDTATITYGDNTIVSTRDTENGTMTLAYATTVALTVPDVANATYVVTVDGEEVTGDNGVFNVPVGSSSVVVTYTGATGYTALNGVFTANINEDTTLDTSAMTIASNATWTGNGDDNCWTTAENWDTQTAPDENTPVVFPAGDWTAVITGWGTAKCASMTVTGNLTLAQSTTGVDANDAGNPYNLDLYGSVAGEGTVTLSNAGIWNGSGDTITFQPSLVVAVSSSDEDSQICGSQVVFNGDVDIQGRLWTKTSGHVFNGETTIQWLTADNARVVFNDDVTLNDGSYVDNYGGYGWQFNGVTVTALGSNGAVFYNGLETETSVTGSGVTFVGKCVFNTYGEAVANITAPVAFTKSATVQLANGGTISSYTTADGYEVVVSDSTLYTCQLASSAAPAIDLTVASPVTVTDTEVTFVVDESTLVSGLYYRVKAVDGDGVESADASTAKVLFTGENAGDLNLTAPLPTEGVLYYTIEASDEQ